MAGIGDIWLALRGKGDQLQVDAKKEGAKAGTAASKSFGSTMKQGLAGGLGFGAALGGVGLVTSAVGSLSDALTGAVADASDLNESMSKSQVVFGDSADEVEKWADTAADAMGLSKQAALEQAGTLGNLLLSMGKTSDEAAKMSMNLVQLAADLGSFNNVDPEEVLVAMRSGLTGEIAPLRRFGVNLTDATLKAKALELGLWDGKKALDVNAKSGAAYALILEQTTTAQGDFARTGEGMANQQKKLAAKLKNTSAEIGTKLIPYVIGAQEAFIDLFDVLDGHKGDIAAIGDSINEELAGGSEEALRQTKAALEQGIKDIQNNVPLWTVVAGGEMQALQDQLAVVDAALARVEAGGQQFSANWGSSAASAITASKKLSGETGDMADDIEADTESAAESFEDMKERLITAAKEAIDNAFDPLITRMKLAAANAEIAAARRVLASKTATTAEKADARETLLTTGKDQAEYLLDLAEAGKTGYKAYKDGLASLKKAVASSSGSAKTALQQVLDKILAVERAGKNVPVNIRVSGGGGSGLSPGGKAIGGAVTQGSSYMVGEKGPELFVPGQSGRIVPHQQSMDILGQAASGGGTTYNIPVQVQGALPVTTIRDVASEMIRLGRTGLLPNPLASPQYRRRTTK